MNLIIGKSFDKHGMVYPITVSPHTEEWVQERLQRGKTPQHVKLPNAK